MQDTTTGIDLAIDVIIGLEDQLTAAATGLLSRISVGDDEADQLLALFYGLQQARLALQDARDRVDSGRSAA